ncbi:MAG: hypothetical protein KDE14_10845 [Rhodobacteraceae bacterium]|nr:hypothetical protein [Paracoccaceae bacterium]
MRRGVGRYFKIVVRLMHLPLQVDKNELAQGADKLLPIEFVLSRLKHTVD